LAGLVKPLRIEHVFDDPLAIRRMVEGHGPYPAMASYLPAATRDGQPGSAEGVLPWFRGTWAAHGRPLVHGAEVILHNPRFLQTASRLFDASEVTPNTVVVNVTAPMPAGAVHVDVPSFWGADRDHYPIRLLQAMGRSGLFDPWRTVEAGAVFWLYDGRGGAYDYWPEGLDGPMHSEHPPFTNSALVADNDRMPHRIGWVGDPAARLPTISVDAEISHLEHGGWAITDHGQTVAHYGDEQIRISILWKAQVRSDRPGPGTAAPLSPDLIVDIFSADLASRGVETPVSSSPLFDAAWVDLVHATYVIPLGVAS